MVDPLSLLLGVFDELRLRGVEGGLGAPSWEAIASEAAFSFFALSLEFLMDGDGIVRFLSNFLPLPSIMALLLTCAEDDDKVWLFFDGVSMGMVRTCADDEEPLAVET